MPLTENDFVEQKAPNGAFSVWTSRDPLRTPFGDYKIELETHPDPELIAQANALVTYVSENIGDIQEVVFEHYQRTCEHKHWMRGCGVPTKLRYDKVAKYVDSRKVYVRRKRDGAVKGSIFLLPKWEPEHGILLTVRDGRLAPDDW
jgi:hypothetical protein